MTLGISTNTRLLGLAIIHQGRLVDYSIRLHKQSWSPAKATRIVTSLEPCVSRYCIKRIILSRPYEYHQTKAWKTLRDRLSAGCLQKGIAVSEETPEALYSFCPKEQKKTKKAMMHSLALRFPELTYYLAKEERNKNKYYYKLFEAVAVALFQESVS